MKKNLAVLLLVVLAAVPAFAARESREVARESRGFGHAVKKVIRQIRSLGDFPTVPIPAPKP